MVAFIGYRGNSLERRGAYVRHPGPRATPVVKANAVFLTVEHCFVSIGLVLSPRDVRRIGNATNALAIS